MACLSWRCLRAFISLQPCHPILVLSRIETSRLAPLSGRLQTSRRSASGACFRRIPVAKHRADSSSELCNFTSQSPLPHHYLAVLPLQSLQTYYGEATACLRRDYGVATGTAWTVLLGARDGVAPGRGWRWPGRIRLPGAQPFGVHPAGPLSHPQAGSGAAGRRSSPWHVPPQRSEHVRVIHDHAAVLSRGTVGWPVRWSACPRRSILRNQGSGKRGRSGRADWRSRGTGTGRELRREGWC